MVILTLVYLSCITQPLDWISTQLQLQFPLFTPGCSGAPAPAYEVQSSKSGCVSSQHFHSAFNPQFAKTSGFCTWYLNYNPNKITDQNTNLSEKLTLSFYPVFSTHLYTPLLEFHLYVNGITLSETTFSVQKAVVFVVLSKTQILAKIYIKIFKDYNLKIWYENDKQWNTACIK